MSLASSGGVIERLKVVLGRAVQLSRDDEYAGRPSWVVWALAAGFHDVDRAASSLLTRQIAELIDKVAFGVSRDAVTPSDRMAEGLHRLASWCVSCDLSEESYIVFGSIPDDWVATLDYCAAVQGTHSPVSEVESNSLGLLLDEISGLRKAVRNAATELGPEVTRMCLDILGRLESAIERFSIDGGDALGELVDYLSGHSRRRTSTWRRLAGSPVTLGVLQLVSTVATIASLSSGGMDSNWTGDVLPEPAHQVECLDNGRVEIGSIESDRVVFTLNELPEAPGS